MWLLDTQRIPEAHWTENSALQPGQLFRQDIVLFWTFAGTLRNHDTSVPFEGLPRLDHMPVPILGIHCFRTSSSHGFPAATDFLKVLLKWGLHKAFAASPIVS
jgi:hypothetical protein